MLKLNYKLVNQNFDTKKFSIDWIEYFIQRGHKFSHKNEMNITTISNKKLRTFEYYNKHPIQMI